MQEKLITPAQAAKILGITVQTVRQWIVRGKISYIRVGGRYRLNESKVLEMMVPHNANESIE